MPMMTPQIFKSVNFTKTQKSRHFKNKSFFLQKKPTLIVHQGLLYAKKSFAAEVIFSRTHKIKKKKKKKKKLLRKNRSPPPGKCFPQNVITHPMRAKIVISPKTAEKYVTPAYRM